MGQESGAAFTVGDDTRDHQILWRPDEARIAQAGFTRFREWLAHRHSLTFEDYEALWRWSVTDIEAFWASVWEFCEVKAHHPYRQVLEQRVMPGAKWFPGATLNYAEHVLRAATRPDASRRAAVIVESETSGRTELSWQQLSGQVGAMARTLSSLGVVAGDRVAAYLPNIAQTVVAMLACVSIGAIWSSAAPDMGTHGVLDRFRQIEPTVLFAVDGYRYGGKPHDRRTVVRELIERLPSVRAVIYLPQLDPDAPVEEIGLPSARTAAGAVRDLRIVSFAQAVLEPTPPVFEALPFDHPLWIVYSSGTTGMPKPIVHGHGGAILENLKFAFLQFDLRADDRFFWFSSTNWIMWNLWASVLMSGATIVGYDGNPGHPDLDTLWRFAEREQVTFFGTSPAFIALNIKARTRPNRSFDLSRIRSVGSTGSPLSVEGYRWVYQNVGSDLLLGSISGGTDPLSAFLTASAVLPVREGEMQCRTLGAAVQSYSDDGKPLIGEVGELVVTEPMPSMPLYFWGDTDGRRYFDSYFETFPGVWRHGDWLKLIERSEAVTSIIYGRSDSTINRHGIRMGTSELYRVVEEFPEVLDSLVVDLEYLGRPSFMALFVVLREAGDGADAGVDAPEARAPEALRQSIREAIRTGLSQRHVPDEVYVIPEVPRTLSGKKLEVPVKRILLGHPVERAVNRDAMANPGSIDWFIAFARRRTEGAEG